MLVGEVEGGCSVEVMRDGDGGVIRLCEELFGEDVVWGVVCEDFSVVEEDEMGADAGEPVDVVGDEEDGSVVVLRVGTCEGVDGLPSDEVKVAVCFV